MELSRAELDCLIVSLRLREDNIRDRRESGALRMLPPELVDSTLVELGALRVKLTAELDRELRRSESKPPAG